MRSWWRHRHRDSQSARYAIGGRGTGGRKGGCHIRNGAYVNKTACFLQISKQWLHRKSWWSHDTLRSRMRWQGPRSRQSPTHHASSSLLSHRVASLVVIVFFSDCAMPAVQPNAVTNAIVCRAVCGVRCASLCVSIRMYMSIHNGIPGANRRNSRAGRRGLAQRFPAAENAAAEVPCGKASTAQSTTFYENFACGAG